MIPTSDKFLGGMRTLVRQNALSLTDWNHLIEERRLLIGPHLNTMELKTIGKIMVADYSADRCLIEHGNPVVFSLDPALTLDTRCWYPAYEGLSRGRLCSQLEHIFDPPGSSPAVGCTEIFWALARSGRWIIVTATVQFPDRRQSWSEMSKSKVLKVDIRETSVLDILSQTKTNSKDMWLQLGRLAREWHKRREYLLAESQTLSNLFDFEEQVLKVSPSQ